MSLNDKYYKLPVAKLLNNNFAMEYNKLSDLLIEKEFIELLKDCADEKRSSQKKIYYIFFDFSISICLRYTKDKEEAVEIMNDAFLKVFKNIKKFTIPELNPIESFKAWVKKIMIYTAIDAFRKNKKNIIALEVDKANEIISTDYTSLDKLSYNEIMSCIMQLSPAYRIVFCLHVVDGFSHEEISEKIGIATGTSKSNLAKARLQLQKILVNQLNVKSYEQRAI
jgi:RNA polymerase sigma factor (sigma-70 family)